MLRNKTEKKKIQKYAQEHLELPVNRTLSAFWVLDEGKPKQLDED